MSRRRAATALGVVAAAAAFAVALGGPGGPGGISTGAGELTALVDRWATTWGQAERGPSCVVDTTAAAAAEVVLLPQAPEPDGVVRVLVVRGQFAGTSLRPRTRFDRLLLAVDDSGRLRGLARRAGTEVDEGLAALGPCRPLPAGA